MTRLVWQRQTPSFGFLFKKFLRRGRANLILVIIILLILVSIPLKNNYTDTKQMVPASETH